MSDSDPLQRVLDALDVKRTKAAQYCARWYYRRDDWRRFFDETRKPAGRWPRGH